MLGGMWIANISSRGCNQYITQRARGASLTTARAGSDFIELVYETWFCWIESVEAAHDTMLWTPNED